MTSSTLCDLGTPEMQAGRAAAIGLPTLVHRQGTEAIAFRVSEEPGILENLCPLNTDAFMGSHKQAIMAELRRLQQSRILVQSDRLRRFLGFAVEATLHGDANALKEYTIGIEAYGRRPDFDPSQDSIVRTEARRLRTKLKKYYLEEGAKNPILIEFRPGSYIPIFYANKATRLSSSVALPSLQYAVSVAPFTNLSGGALGEACARGLTDEFMHRLTRTDGISVFTAADEQFADRGAPVATQRMEGVLISEGSVRTEGRRIRVTSRLHDAGGLHLASWRFDTEASPDELFSALEKIASEIATCLDRHRMGLLVS